MFAYLKCCKWFNLVQLMLQTYMTFWIDRHPIRFIIFLVVPVISFLFTYYKKVIYYHSLVSVNLIRFPFEIKMLVIFINTCSLIPVLQITKTSFLFISPLSLLLRYNAQITVMLVLKHFPVSPKLFNGDGLF